MKKQYTLYIIFAIICTFVNLGSQFLTKILIKDLNLFSQVVYSANNKNLHIYDLIKIIVGTGFGFGTKFILDKFFVFEEKVKSLSHTFKQILLYGTTAIFTTLIFWGFQIGFKLIFHFPFSEEIGAITGLAIGYTIKFFLDKKIVFKEDNPKKEDGNDKNGNTNKQR